MGDYTLADALLGGPGLDGYAYQADVYCKDCAEAIIRKVYGTWGIGSGAPLREKGPVLDDLDFQDSEILPQPIFFGESDGPEHCAECGEYLYGENEPLENEDDSGESGA